jgi:hypothetical protein
VALSAIPAICLELLVTLVFALAGWQPRSWMVALVAVAGGGWFVALLVTATRLVREQGLEGAG